MQLATLPAAPVSRGCSAHFVHSAALYISAVNNSRTLTHISHPLCVATCRPASHVRPSPKMQQRRTSGVVIGTRASRRPELIFVVIGKGNSNNEAQSISSRHASLLVGKGVATLFCHKGSHNVVARWQTHLDRGTSLLTRLRRHTTLLGAGSPSPPLPGVCQAPGTCNHHLPAQRIRVHHSSAQGQGRI